MLSLFTALSCALVLVTGATATPARRATCTPNAQGAGVSIQSSGTSGLEWGVNSTPQSGFVLAGHSFRGFAAPDYHIQQNGQVPASFVIKDVNNNNLAVTTSGSGLAFGTASNSGLAVDQLFGIVCQTCGNNPNPGNVAGSYCTISPIGQNTLCVKIGPNAQDALKVVNCDGSNAQLFNIVF